MSETRRDETSTGQQCAAANTGKAFRLHSDASGPVWLRWTLNRCMPAIGRRTPFEKANWTPRALEVFATAKALASPNPIRPRDLLLAMEAGDTVAHRVFKKLSMLPSVVLNQTPPTSLLPDGELCFEDFENDFGRNLPRLAAAEARGMGWAYLGTDALLLLLARLGVAGFDLPYNRIREIVPQVM